MKKIIFIILIIFGFNSCTLVYLGVIDLAANKILYNKDERYNEYLKSYEKNYKGIESADNSYNLVEKNINDLIYYEYKKNDSKNLIIYVHGGAFLRTIISQHYIEFIQDIIYKSSVDYEVIFLDYKGEKFPSQTYELDKLIDSVSFKYDKIILFGDSSGGNVIISNTLYRRDHNKSKVDALILLSPFSDPSNRVKSRFTNFKKDILMGKSMYNKDLLYNRYLSKEDLNNKYASVVYADFYNFPDTLIQYGDLEILEDDSKIVCYKINESKGNCKLEPYSNMLHVFQLFNLFELSRVARENIAVYIDKVFLN